MNESKKILNKESSNFEDEIDILNIAKILLRNKFFIVLIGFLFFGLACVYALKKQKIWEGRFEIVLDRDNSEKNNFQINPAFQRIVGNSSMVSNNLKTEVGILESPSVLMPVFDFVNQERKKINKEYKKANFLDWKQSSLKVKLKPGTSILNIIYRDKNKDLIIPVLEKMSNIYQNYTGKEKERKQLLTKSYLENQIELFKQKSSKSIKIVQEFAIDQDLNFQNFSNKNVLIDTKQSNNLLGPSLSLSNIGIETIRVNAANKIREINSQIQKIDEIGDNYEQLQYIGSTIPALVKEGLPQSLKEIEDKLVNLRSKYTENDRLIRLTIEQRNLLIGLLKKRAIGILKAQKLVQESRMIGATRPKGVLLKYKELLREAKSDELTLINFENQYRFIDLEIAKTSEPWKLVTDPTVLSFPVAPSKRKIALFGMLLGLIFGSIAAIYKEKRSGLIFDIESLEKIFPVPIFKVRINENKLIQPSDEKNILMDFLQTTKGENIFILPLTELNLDGLINYLRQSEGIKNKKEVFCSKQESDFKKFISSDIKIIAGSIGNISFKEIENLKKRLDIFNANLSGVILLDIDK